MSVQIPDHRTHRYSEAHEGIALERVPVAWMLVEAALAQDAK